MKRFVTYDLLVVYQNGGSDLYHPSVHDNADTIEELLSETDKYLEEKVPDWGIVQVQFRTKNLMNGNLENTGIDTERIVLTI